MGFHLTPRVRRGRDTSATVTPAPKSRPLSCSARLRHATLPTLQLLADALRGPGLRDVPGLGRAASGLQREHLRSPKPRHTLETAHYKLKIHCICEKPEFI